MEGSMIAPAIIEDPVKNLEVDLDPLKSNSSMKIRRGVGATRKSLAQINLIKNK